MTTKLEYVGPARTFEEYVAALELAYLQYLDAGYMTQKTAGIRWSVGDLVLGTRTLVAVHEGQVVTTGTIIPSSLQEFPSEEIFHPSVDALRDAGRSLVESVRFASRAVEVAEGGEGVGGTHELIQHALWCAHFLADSYITVVNPKHVRNWNKIYGLEPLAEVEALSSVQGHPGVFLHLDLKGFFSGAVPVPRGFRRFILDRPVERAHLIGSGYELRPLDLFALLVLDQEEHQIITERASGEIRARFSEVFRLLRGLEHGRELSKVLPPGIFGTPQRCGVGELSTALRVPLAAALRARAIEFEFSTNALDTVALELDPYLVVLAGIEMVSALADLMPRGAGGICLTLEVLAQGVALKALVQRDRVDSQASLTDVLFGALPRLMLLSSVPGVRRSVNHRENSIQLEIQGRIPAEKRAHGVRHALEGRAL